MLRFLDRVLIDWSDALKDKLVLVRMDNPAAAYANHGVGWLPQLTAFARSPKARELVNPCALAA